jgi:hypothetical protein
LHVYLQFLLSRFRLHSHTYQTDRLGQAAVASSFLEMVDSHVRALVPLSFLVNLLMFPYFLAIGILLVIVWHY